jgi:hypothetical protein
MKPTIGTAKSRFSPKYAQGLSGLYWSGSSAAVTGAVLAGAAVTGGT